MKKTIALLLTTVFLFALAGCGGGTGTGSGHTIKVWASQADQALTRELVDRFIAENPQFNVTIELGVIGEPDAWKTFSEDPSAAADVFYFPNDQLRDFVNAGGLYALQLDVDEIIARNVESAVDSATLNDVLWAYPATADNGYFLYYDKSVLSEDDIQSLDRILEVSDAAGKKMHMHLYDNGWYVASFFLGAGNTITIGPDGKQVVDFSNATGLAAARAMQEFTAHPAYINGDDSVLMGGIGGSIAAGVSGIWNAEGMTARLGENYGAAKLPTFTLNGEQVQMGSFGGYKLVGVNAMITNAEKLVIAMELANFLTNEQSQLARFNDRGIGPSNIGAASAPAVQANPALAALAAQSEFATSQNDVLGDYWSPAGAFGVAMVTHDASDLQTLINNMVAQIQS